MGFEMEFFRVGTGTKGGDAILFQYGDLREEPGERQIVVIDGGTKETGSQIANQIKSVYKASFVDAVYLSHADGDHASGLTELISDEDLEFGVLYMHSPWLRSGVLLDRMKDGRITEFSLAGRISEALRYAKEVSDIAEKRGIEIREIFQGECSPDGVITVLGPTEDFYTERLLASEDTPTTTEVETAKAMFQEFCKTSSELAKDAAIEESMEMSTETLVDPEPYKTSDRNNQSLILGIQIEGRSILLTADAGLEALNPAMDFAESIGFNTKDLYLFQVPHHGSKHNIGPTFLNERIQGKRAVISAPKEWSHHPSKKVMNALTRRGWQVFLPNPTGRFKFNAPDREKEKTWDCQPFFELVEK